jgi:hypothetical protein
LLIESCWRSPAGIGLYVANLALGLIARFQLPGVGSPASRWAQSIALFTAITPAAPVCCSARAGLARLAKRRRRIMRSATSARSGLRSTLVAAQVALSLVLLVGTGLFLRSLACSLQVPLGVSTDGVTTATVNLGVARYDMPRARVFYDQVLGRIRQLPGVTAAAWTTILPLNGDMIMMINVEGYQEGPAEDIKFHGRRQSRLLQAAGTRLRCAARLQRRDSASSPRGHHQRNSGAQILGRAGPAPGPPRGRRPVHPDRRCRGRHQDRGAG